MLLGWVGCADLTQPHRFFSSIHNDVVGKWGASPKDLKID